MLPLNEPGSNLSLEAWNKEMVVKKELPDAFRRIYHLNDGRIIAQTSRTALNYKTGQETWAEVVAVPNSEDGNLFSATKQSFPVTLDLNTGWGKVGLMR